MVLGFAWRESNMLDTDSLSSFVLNTIFQLKQYNKKYTWTQKINISRNKSEKIRFLNVYLSAGLPVKKGKNGIL